MTRRLRARRGAVRLIAGALALSGCRQADDPNVIRLNGRIEATHGRPQPEGHRPRASRCWSGGRSRQGRRRARPPRSRRDGADGGPRPVGRRRRAGARPRPRSRQPPRGDRRRRGGSERSQGRPRPRPKKELQRQQFLLDAQGRHRRDVDRATTEVERREAALSVASRTACDRCAKARARGRCSRRRTTCARTQTVLEQSQTIVERGRAARAGRRHRGPSLRRARPAADARPAGADAGVPDRLYVRTFVPETLLGRVQPGQRGRGHRRRLQGQDVQGARSPRSRATPSSRRSRSRRAPSASTSSTPRRSIWSAAGTSRSFPASRPKSSIRRSTGRLRLITTIARQPDAHASARRRRSRGVTLEVAARRDVRADRARRRRQDDVLPPRRRRPRADLRHGDTCATGTFGLVPQRFGLYQDLSIDENLRLRARLYDVPRDEAERARHAPARHGRPRPVPRAASPARSRAA